MSKMYLNRALARALKEEMDRDARVALIGEDVINKGGGMSNFVGTYEAHPDKCFDMPIAELGYTHFSVGAAMSGQIRPVVDLMFSDFSTLAAAAIMNNAAKQCFYTRAAVSVPMVVTMANGGKAVYGGVGSGANHSQCMEAMFMNCPGLKIVMPYYAGDAYGLMKAAIRDDDPVLFFYPEGSLGKKSEVPDEEFVIPLNNAANVRREGSDATVIAIQSMVPVAEAAADELEKEGVHVELIDPRVIIPLDTEKIFASVKKTGRVVIVHEAPVRGGVGAEIAATIYGDAACAKALNGRPVKRVGALNSPIPSGYTEELMMPHSSDIVSAVKDLL